MQRIRWIAGPLLAALLVLPAELAAQPNRILPIEDWTYPVIRSLQLRGHLVDLHPTVLPYTRGEVVRALRKIDETTLDPLERQWVDRLKDELRVEKEREALSRAGVQFDGGVTLTDSRRIDVERPLTRDIRVFSIIGMDLYLDDGPIVANIGLRYDLYNVWDPDAIDSALRLYVRGENSYVGYNRRQFAVYLGRYGHHWAPSGDPATVIGRNPKTYDKIAMRFGGRLFSVHALFGELDSIELDLTFDGRAGDRSDGRNAYGDRFGSIRRFITAHRLDWRPSRHLNLAYLQSVIISSDNSGFSLQWLSPVANAIFETDSYPKNDEHNAMIAGLLFLTFNRLTFHGQFMLDDIDLVKTGEPAALSLMGATRYAARSVDLGLELEIASARSYKSEQVEGHYLYLLRGLATQFTDYVRLSPSAEFHLDRHVPGLSVAPRFTALLSGEQEIIGGAYPDDTVPFVLAGTETRLYRTSVLARYVPNRYVWTSIDAGINHTRNLGHRPGQTETRPTVLLNLGMRFPYTYRRRTPF